ncbi:hypothetical protein [Polyangium jinanense]|uniref:Uncharacterized protein n=1 Tax=Polyangium jinanense TaxID=2829994 RepID=A0A9X4AQW8_9BACT|nr:hypothetical protein [Polyangium jinanense]MDC3955213.1 hypothetical protein [Polyangium jinanense]MDC3981514.1 hypothetical protein [Polyangium jinanense]
MTETLATDGAVRHTTYFVLNCARFMAIRTGDARQEKIPTALNGALAELMCEKILGYVKV